MEVAERAFVVPRTPEGEEEGLVSPVEGPRTARQGRASTRGHGVWARARGASGMAGDAGLVPARKPGQALAWVRRVWARRREPAPVLCKGLSGLVQDGGRRRRRGSCA